MSLMWQLILIIIGSIVACYIIGSIRESLGIQPPTEEERRRKQEENERRRREQEKRHAIEQAKARVVQDSVYTKEYLDKNPAVRIRVAQNLAEYEEALHK